MAIIDVRIHPAIGIARVGNSPTEFFIGPERPWEVPAPPGGFKDAQCRVKRQGARFRIFAYHDDGSVDEITAAEADITWTVHLANKKAVTRNAGAPADLTIDPGPRTLSGATQRSVFDTGRITLPGAGQRSVPLGEIRTDGDARLIVLGGFGDAGSPTGAGIGSFYDNPGWYDDISDGPVTARIRLHATGDVYDAIGAWVIVGPPKFAPQIENVITLYDTVVQLAVGQGWLAAPAVPSYTHDVYPILERARTTKWVVNTSAHSWPDPVYADGARAAIFGRIANPGGGGGNMPILNSAQLTATQYEVMQKWSVDNFARDWVATPTPAANVTPSGLDRAALEACVGAAFFPGIEAGGITANPIIDAANYVGPADPMRLNHAVLGAGDMSRHMALPWQADFKACGTSWWPVPRPNSVIPEGTTSRQSWDRDVGSMAEMVDEWHTLGFVVRQGTEFVEVERCDTTYIALTTPHLVFQDVPQGPMGMARKTARAVAFEVRSTGAAVTLEVASGPTHPRLTLSSTSETVGPTGGNEVATLRLWVLYETGASGEAVTDVVTVRHPASGRTWTVTIAANTVPRKVVATALVLDRSGSMTENRGDGQSKHQSLKEAASVFVDVMLEGDGVGIVRYNQDAQPLSSVTTLGPASDPFDAGRRNAKDIISGPDLAPSGATSIGDGIYEGRQILNTAASSYDVKALVVLTDGKENRSRYIADVAGEINERTYAIGLGTAQNTSAPALQALSGNHGGYLLVTGAITGDNRFILQKYFLQILAGINSADVVLDPTGELVAGQEQRIPFQLTEQDAGFEAIVLAPNTKYLDFRLQTPNGFVLEPWRARAESNMEYVHTEGTAFYRIALPVELHTARFEQPGTWHAVLSIGSARLEPPARKLEVLRAEEALSARRFSPQSASVGMSEVAYRAAHGHVDDRRTLPFSLLVHSYSNLSFRAALVQSGYEPGAGVKLSASLTESGVPPRPGTHVWVELTRPDGSLATVSMAERDPGQFIGTFATAEAGVYRCRVRASGRSREGYPFAREQTLTAAVWHGGDRDADPNQSSGGPLVRWLEERDARLCALLRCLLAEGGVLTPAYQRRLLAEGFDVRRLRRCLAAYCQPRTTNETDDSTLDRPLGAGAVARPSRAIEELLRELGEDDDVGPCDDD
jgi:hypothetical protein